MGSYLNLIGSFIIGGLFLLTINRFQASFNQNSNEKLLEVITIQKSSAVIKLIEHDFNRMGYGLETSLYQPNVEVIVLADSNRIHFLSDINMDDTVNVVKYYLSDVSAADGTDNPEDKILYRLVDSEPEADAALGVTRFRIRYFKSDGSEVTNLTDMTQLAQVRTFDITLMVESTIGYDDQYSSFYWQTKITPPNIARY